VLNRRAKKRAIARLKALEINLQNAVNAYVLPFINVPTYISGLCPLNIP
jgi:hypothetical protein